ncbi:MAG TPA: 50S ribosomal protein L10 [Candidatus Nanoarchaeia archaeon]|nr:50S ribosomal protein L10 [Candidatus Nanoarchaeia archaeon]
MTKTSKAAPEKKEVVKKIQDLSKKYPIIGILNLENMPASSLLKMKKQLRGKVELVMTRKTLLKLGLEKLNLPSGEKLIESLKGMPALMFTKENPFALYNIIKKSKTPAAAKPGQLAPHDITLQPGPTPFTPGPVISEFAQLGIKAGVEGGKVAIKQETTVVKEGQPISGPLASMLQRLGVEPMEIGLDLHCVYEKGIIYPKTVLDIDETKFMQDLMGAAGGAFNLAIEITFISKDTIETLLSKAFREAKAVGIEGNVMEPELVEEILAKGYRAAQAVAQEGNVQTQ